MRISDLTINNSSFGKQKILVDIRPVYNYESNSKEIEGYKYNISFLHITHHLLY